MTAADPKFVLRIVGWQALFSVGTSLLGGLSAPRLLLLGRDLQEATTIAVIATNTHGRRELIMYLRWGET